MHITIGFDIFDNSTSPTRDKKGNSILDIVDNYIVLDLETTGLSPNYSEIIEIGMIKVENNIIIDTFETLIKPKAKVDSFITDLTGITNEMLQDKKPIEELLPQILNFIDDNVIVAHNANFDINFLYDNVLKFNYSPLTNDFIDTMRLSRKIEPTERHHRLKDLVARFNISHKDTHRALSDCYAAYDIYTILKSKIIENNIDLKALSKKKSYNISEIVATSTDFNTSHPFYQQKFVFTGALQKYTRKEAMQIIANIGGANSTSISKTTNYLVVGNLEETILQGEKSSKILKAEKLIIEGNDLKIISEKVFYEILETEY